MRIVHEGRGGYIELDDRRYPIEHIEGGRFSIHYPAGKRANPEHLSALQHLVDSEPDKWAVESTARKPHR